MFPTRLRRSLLSAGVAGITAALLAPAAAHAAPVGRTETKCANSRLTTSTKDAFVADFCWHWKPTGATFSGGYGGTWTDVTRADGNRVFVQYRDSGGAWQNGARAGRDQPVVERFTGTFRNVRKISFRACWGDAAHCGTPVS